MIVHADARPGSQFSEERLGMGDLDCDLVPTEAGSEDELIANVRDADVFEEEPLPADSPLCRLENVVLTPHVASASPGAMRQVRQEVGRAAADVLRGRWPKYVANPSVKPRWPLEGRRD